MTTFIIQGGLQIETDFWAKHAPLLNIAVFAKLKETYEDSSRIMWAIVMDYEVAQYNPYCRMPDDQKLSALQQYCATYDRDSALIGKVTQTFLSMYETEAKRSYRTHSEDMANRTWMIKKLTAYLKEKIEEDPSCIADKAISTAMTTLENMRKNTDLVFKKFATVERQFIEDEAARSRIMGGGELSLFEDGGLVDVEDTDDDWQPATEPKADVVSDDNVFDELPEEEVDDLFSSDSTQQIIKAND